MYRGTPSRKVEQILKTFLSSDRGLQFDLVKPESLAIVDQYATVNTFSGLVLTARHAKGADNARRPI